MLAYFVCILASTLRPQIESQYSVRVIAPPTGDTVIVSGLNNSGTVSGYSYQHVPPGHGDSACLSVDLERR